MRRFVTDGCGTEWLRDLIAAALRISCRSDSAARESQDRPIDPYRIDRPMTTRSLLTTLAFATLFIAGCGDGTQEQSPGEVLARDSSLASELKQADTSAFAEAADVAMAFDPDSAMPPVETASPAREPVARPAPEPERAPPTAVASVPMRVNRPNPPVRSSMPEASAPASVARPAPSRPAPSRPVQMRPAPATIHADPLPERGVSPTPGSRVSTSRTTPARSNAATILERVPGATLPPAGSDEPCASPAAPSQRRCLMLHLARSDVMLDRTYQSLIADMKRAAGTPAGAKEPASVEQLRVSQRAWLVYRDTECRRRNRGKEGPLWAPVRAQCLGEFSGQRTEELAQALRERR